jgi:exodeoxyribonuclease VII large subunit
VEQICSALRLAQARAECDVLILCRGGGSLEDLIAFNDETVARAIHACRIPLVCGVGHEIDFTIADFVADRRAPTPSVAAELASPNRDDWLLRLRQLQARLQSAWSVFFETRSVRLVQLGQRLRLLHPGKRLRQQQQRVDELEQRLAHATAVRCERAAHRLGALSSRLWARTPAHRLERLRMAMTNLEARLRKGIEVRLRQSDQRLARAARTLDAVSPLGTLKRGYSITRRVADGRILRDSGETQPGEQVETRLAQGRILCEVRECKSD